MARDEDRAEDTGDMKGRAHRRVDEIRDRQVSQLSRVFRRRDVGRVEVFRGTDLDCGNLGLLHCDLALAPAGMPLSLLSVGLVVLYGGRQRLELSAAVEVIECWFIDTERGWVERYLLPDEGRYRVRTLVYPGEWVSPHLWPDLAVQLLERSTRLPE